MSASGNPNSGAISMDTSNTTPAAEPPKSMSTDRSSGGGGGSAAGSDTEFVTKAYLNERLAQVDKRLDEMEATILKAITKR
mmetsp:Transcript_26625/g.67847  ORF Transcript_26625/g.67847 Transcript_26625/m.67847 type:complete len:81 (-) Transcript_26625:121-363(-)